MPAAVAPAPAAATLPARARTLSAAWCAAAMRRCCAVTAAMRWVCASSCSLVLAMRLRSARWCCARFCVPMPASASRPRTWCSFSARLRLPHLERLRFTLGGLEGLGERGGWFPGFLELAGQLVRPPTHRLQLVAGDGRVPRQLAEGIDAGLRALQVLEPGRAWPSRPGPGRCWRSSGCVAAAWPCPRRPAPPPGASGGRRSFLGPATFARAFAPLHQLHDTHGVQLL